MKLKNTTLEWHDTSKELPMEHEAITFWRKGVIMQTKRPLILRSGNND